MAARTGVICALLAVAALAAAAGAAAPGEVDVSRSPGLQAEVAVAADPADPHVLLAASNSSRPGDTQFILAYTSTDGGSTWRVEPAPTPSPLPTGHRRCAISDPVPAIAADGTEYLSFLVTDCLRPGTKPKPSAGLPAVSVDVASRAAPGAPWRVAAVFPTKGQRYDDKPMISVAPTGRVYAAFTRTTAKLHGTRLAHVRTQIVVSHSDTKGATWTIPVPASDTATTGVSFGQVAVDTAGNVFVAWVDDSGRILLDHGRDDRYGHDIVVDTAGGRLPRPGSECSEGGDRGLPAQPKRCVTPAPSLAIDERPGVPERVYLTYAKPGADGIHEEVDVASFDQSLHRLPAAPLPPAGPRADRFLPASALGPDGRLWVCFYDTGADRTGKSARYMCTASADGGATWATPAAVASVASNETQPKSSPFEFGDYEGVAVGSDGIAHPMWTDSRDLATRREEIYTAAVAP